MPNSPLSGPQLSQRFTALDSFLQKHQALWKPRPFTELQLPWEVEYPELAVWLRQRSLQQAEADHLQAHLLDAPAPFPELARQAIELSTLGNLPSKPPGQLNPALSFNVPGRKWQQILAFADSLNFTKNPQHWLDWCAGKGHLGRLLAHQGQPLISLEVDPALVTAGQQMSDRLAIQAEHLQQDVCQAEAADHLRAEHTAVALHACGDLHVRLLRLASQAGCRQLAVAPCCYNRITASHYQALSQRAQNSSLQLSRDDLRLPLTETVTAGKRVRRQRDTSMARRLGFDLLQRQLSGQDSYQPVPSLAPAWLDKTFTHYCQDLAALQGLSAPATYDWPALENQAWKRLAEVRNLELLRGLFRRPLELWLVLDRALFLEEQGYSVKLGCFCPTQSTPRNLLLLAERL